MKELLQSYFWYVITMFCEIKGKLAHKPSINTYRPNNQSYFRSLTTIRLKLGISRAHWRVLLKNSFV